MAFFSDNNIQQIDNLRRKVQQYKDVLANTESYRQAWRGGFRDEIVEHLQGISQDIGLEVELDIKSDIENLEAIVLSLGDAKSGMFQRVNKAVERHLIKHNGSLVYQQLFNGKIIVLINYPYIESYGKPRPAKTIAIYRPEELKPPFYIRHMEELLREITNWEDYDDDDPNKRIGFQFNFGNAGETAQE